MVRSIRCLATETQRRRRSVAGRMAMVAVWWLGAAATLLAQSPPVHYLHHGVMPPGAIGSRQLQRGGPLPGFFQPVEIKVPDGALISLAADCRFESPQSGPKKAGLLIGAVYRLRITNIRLAEGQEVFPTIEVIDRLYAPIGQETRFAIPVDITEEDLKLAMSGRFVTRVIYLEDPQRALPARENPPAQTWFEAAPGQDPLAVADGLGRPVAILRLGARLPEPAETLEPSFYFGSPPFVAIASDVTPMPKPVRNLSAPVESPKVQNLSMPPTVAGRVAETGQGGAR
ncbi:MAG: hypothetical protein ABFC77_05495 [Thermoguttaceae bacterium]